MLRAVGGIAHLVSLRMRSLIPWSHNNFDSWVDSIWPGKSFDAYATRLLACDRQRGYGGKQTLERVGKNRA